ncbi:COP9 signalosome complex subunit 7b [Nymphon striatum]|nr:COP9 signalosome complex subunit 7b [Nymphon striatum]
MTEKTSSIQPNPCEQYVLLAKSVKGAAAVQLIKQVLDTPGVYVFGELLDVKNIQEISSDPEHSKYLNLLNLFAYGTYADYIANKSSLPDISPAQLTKLRHLTIVSLATKSKCIPYSVLLKELDLKNLRELEDLIIEVVYAEIVEGKLDQKNHQFEVDSAIGRDIRPDGLGTIIDVLQEWCDNCESVLSNIENQVVKANKKKINSIQLHTKLENEVLNIKKTLKSQSQEGDEPMINLDIREAQSQ